MAAEPTTIQLARSRCCRKQWLANFIFVVSADRMPQSRFSLTDLMLNESDRKQLSDFVLKRDLFWQPFVAETFCHSRALKKMRVSARASSKSLFFSLLGLAQNLHIHSCSPPLSSSQIIQGGPKNDGQPEEQTRQ